MAVERAQQAIDKMASERERLLSWVRSIAPDDWRKLSSDGMWQARDYVAHLASIDPLLVRIIRSFQGKSSSEGGRDSTGAFSIDDWNEEQILERREHSIDELIAEMAKYRVDLNAAMTDFTDEQLDQTFRFGGDQSRSPRDTQVGEFLRGLVYHDRWHTEDARRAIAGELEQPFGDKARNKTLTTEPSVSA